MRSEKSDEIGKNCDIVDLIQNYQVVIAIQSLLIILSLVWRVVLTVLDLWVATHSISTTLETSIFGNFSLFIEFLRSAEFEITWGISYGFESLVTMAFRSVSPASCDSSMSRCSVLSVFSLSCSNEDQDLLCFANSKSSSPFLRLGPLGRLAKH